MLILLLSIDSHTLIYSSCCDKFRHGQQSFTYFGRLRASRRLFVCKKDKCQCDIIKWHQKSNIYDLTTLTYLNLSFTIPERFKVRNILVIADDTFLSQSAIRWHKKYFETGLLLHGNRAFSFKNFKKCFVSLVNNGTFTIFAPV